MDERLDIRKMKEIVHDIIGEEARNNNVSVNVFPLTFVEYYKGFEKREGRGFKLKKDTFQYISARGFFRHSNKNLYICLNNNMIFLNNYCDLAKVCYHEFRHRMQENFEKYSYESFLTEMEDLIRFASPFDYFLKHDDYSNEIGANIYGVSKAREYLQKKHPKLYEKEKEYIDMMEQGYMIDYLSYDASDVVDRFISSKEKADTKISKKYGDGSYVDWRGGSVLEVFFNKDLTFKKVSEIINHEEFKQLDPRIISAIFSSRSFLSNLDMENLSLEELDVVSNALQYTSNIYKNQINSLLKLNIKRRDKMLDCLNIEKSFLKKYAKICMYISKNIQRKINLANDEDYRRQNAEYVRQKLNQSKRLIKQKSNRGFFVSDMFYIIGLLFSLLTILYLIISKL